MSFTLRYKCNSNNNKYNNNSSSNNTTRMEHYLPFIPQEQLFMLFHLFILAKSFSNAIRQTYFNMWFPTSSYSAHNMTQTFSHKRYIDLNIYSKHLLPWPTLHFTNKCLNIKKTVGKTVFIAIDIFPAVKPP